MNSGRLGQHVVGLGEGVEAERHAIALAFRHAPVDDPHDLAPAQQPGRHAHLPAGLVGGL
jgi:hypothetical protein